MISSLFNITEDSPSLRPKEEPVGNSGGGGRQRATIYRFWIGEDSRKPHKKREVGHIFKMNKKGE